MPKKAKELSALEVKNLTKPGLHAVGCVAGLLLQISSSGASSWILRAMIGSKRRDIGLGGYPDVTLAQARDKARELRADIRAGIDPVEERREARARLITSQATKLTFDDAVKMFLPIKQAELTNKKSAAQWSSTLTTYASPVIGKQPVADIELNHIIQILEPIWQEKTETAKRLRGRIEAVLAWATVAGYRTGDNPARWKGHLDVVLPKPGKITKVKHHKALPWQEIGLFLKDLRSQKGIGARALEFLILTATRSGEVRGAIWSEIDLIEKIWTIPADRMKAGKEHRVPLSVDAVKLLESLPRMKDDNHIFPAPRGGILSDMSLSAILRRMEVNAVPHGFRSTFRDWCAEHTNYPTAVAEMALAHTIGNKVEAAYRRGDLFTKRTRLMNEWSTFCFSTQKTAEVLAIGMKINGQ